MIKRLHIFVFGLLTLAAGSLAQPVNVTVALDNAQISAGGSTTLHVYAQIATNLQGTTDRIFSWYVDLLDLNGSVATISSAQVTRPASDKDPATSSAGTTNGANLMGIYDTFINLPDAGRTNRVELFNVPIKGISPGQVTFRVQAGTTKDLSADFQVAPKGGGDALTGGNYSAATVLLNVVVSTAIRLNISSVPGQATLSYSVVSGKSYFVEFADALTATTTWQTLPNGPHNSGNVVVQSTGTRFYRLRVNTP